MTVPLTVPQLPLDDTARCGWRPDRVPRVEKNGRTFALMCGSPRLHDGGHRLEWVEVGPRIAPVDTKEYL